jgi:hypothetical protein
MGKINYDGMAFRINFIAEGGRFLLATEWTTDRAAIIHLADSINCTRAVRIRAAIETKGTAYVDIAKGQQQAS